MYPRHSVYFDGTSYFVDSFDFEMDADTERVFTSTDLQKCWDKCDELNAEL